MAFPSTHARAVLEDLAEAREHEDQLSRDRLDTTFHAAWIAVIDAYQRDAISEERYERYEALAIEEGLDLPPSRVALRQRRRDEAMRLHDETMSALREAE